MGSSPVLTSLERGFFFVASPQLAYELFMCGKEVTMIGLIQLKRMLQLVIIILCSLFLIYGHSVTRKFFSDSTQPNKLPAYLTYQR